MGDVRPLDVAAGGETVGLEQTDRVLSDAPEDADGLWREECRDGFRLEGHEGEAVGLVLLGADLREESIGGDSHRTSHAAGSPHFGAEGFAKAHGVVPMEMKRSADVEEGFVNRHALDERRVVLENLEDAT